MPSNSLSVRLYRKFKNRTKLYIYTPLIAYWLFLFSLSTIPVDAVPILFEIQDKVEHFLAYMVLAVLLNFTLHFQRRIESVAAKSFLFTLIFIFLYAAVDEVHQIFIPGRYCDPLDWIADSLGGVIGTISVRFFLLSVEKNMELSSAK
ncbi:MAG: VanZ family protein [Ignavibacteriales bacterium]|nr:VanZ family protein [Ignavibacteriales bacterium]